LMNRTYTKEWYMKKVERIKEIMPDCALSSDVITGFCTETEEDHQETLAVMEHANYDLSYMFAYSERPGTLAQRRYEDDVTEEVKKRRLAEVIEVQNKMTRANYNAEIGKTFEVLIENTSKRSEEQWAGRNTQNKVIVFAKGDYNLNKGDYVNVKVTATTGATLIGEIESIPE